jgi:hypothetical protein
MFTMTILDGQLGLVPPSTAGASVDLGVCSDGVASTLYTAGNTNSAVSQLGQGPLVEALADRLSFAGGPGYAVPLTPSTLGSAGSTTYAGTGTGTVVADEAPHKQILLKIETGGAPGTMTFRYSVGGAAYSAPIATTAGVFVYLVPGTMCKVTFADQTYTTLAVWTISTAGVIGLVGTGTVGWVTQASSPLDAYDIRVIVKTSGALGAGVFTYSVDGSNTTSGDILIPSGGVYVIPNTGIFLTFAGTFTAHALAYTIACTTSTFTTSDVNTAMTYLLGLPLEWGFVHLVGAASSAANAATMASTLDTHMAAAELAFRYVFAVMECPTGGSDTDAVVAAAFASFVSKRVVVCAGDIGHLSSVYPGRVTRRNCGTVVASKIAKVRPGTSIAWVQDPPNPIEKVKSLYRDEQATPLLDAARFTTMTSKIGVIGYFITHGKTMAAPGSDFGRIDYRRPMDVACKAARAMFLPFEEQTIPVNPPGSTKAGKVHEKWALRMEALAKKRLEAALNIGHGANEDADAQAAEVVIDRDENILSTRIFKIAVRIVPNGKAEAVEVTMGFMNPALQ